MGIVRIVVFCGTMRFVVSFLNGVSMLCPWVKAGQHYQRVAWGGGLVVKLVLVRRPRDNVYVEFVGISLFGWRGVRGASTS